MKKLLMFCFLFVLAVSFVVTAGSEVSSKFIINDRDSVVDNADFVPIPTFWDSYGNQLIAVVVVLIILYVLFKVSSKKKVKKRSKKKRKGKSRKRK